MLTQHQLELVANHLHLTTKFVLRHKHKPFVRAYPSLEDAIQTAALAICEAARTYNPDKGARFVTVAWLAMTRKLMRDSRLQYTITLPYSFPPPIPTTQLKH